MATSHGRAPGLSPEPRRHVRSLFQLMPDRFSDWPERHNDSDYPVRNTMRFGVFIRSTGERTEKLCEQAVRLHVPAENIHLLRGYYPSYKVFQKMFKIAGRERYDWYLGLDADVVLRKDWLELFQQKLANEETNQYFRIFFHVRDAMAAQPIVRGNNWYNFQHHDLTFKYYKRNIRIGRYWFYYKHKGFGSGCFTKPESSIRTHMRKESGILDHSFKEIVGWHGFEQYHAEIFRQYLTRYRRDPNFINTAGNEFLRADWRNDLIQNNDMEKYAANLGWNCGPDWKAKYVDARMNARIQHYLQKRGVAEKPVLRMSLDEFYDRYA